MEKLLEIYNKHKKGDWPDKGSVHSYIELYDWILEPYRESAKNILEIGLMSGESLRMWDEYFSGDVYGMDCDIRPHGGLADLTETIGLGYKVCIGDAESEKEVEKYFNGMKFDVIIEDAGHHVPQQLKIYSVFKKYLNEGGIYIIEDIQNIDDDHFIFENMDLSKNVTIYDRRNVKGRYDDCLVVIKDKA